MSESSTRPPGAIGGTDRPAQLRWQRVWIVVDRGIRLYFSAEREYRVVSTEFVDGMRLVRPPSGRIRRVFYATRAYIDPYQSQARYELLSIHGTASAAIRACERDWAEGDRSMAPSGPRKSSR